MSAREKIDELLTLGLTPEEAAKLSRKTAAFTLRKEIIEHTKFTKAIREIARVHQRGQEAGITEGMLLVAQTGSGKTTVLEYYERGFPRAFKDGVTRIRVLRVNTPESPSVKDLAEAILCALGDPAAAKGTAAAKTRRICHFFSVCGVELLLVDEFQHFFDGTRVAESRRISNWLKLLMIQVRVPVVLAGLPRSIQVVNLNPQLRRRFAAPYYMEPFAFGTKEEQTELRGVLLGIQQGLPCGSIDLSEANMAKRFYYASHGLFDYIVKIIDDAASRGGSGPSGQLTMRDYAEAFKRVVWFDAPDMLNPFMEQASLRLLTQPLEPFDIWDDIANYTKLPSSHRQAGAGRSVRSKMSKKGKQ
jgi:Bacterial TniB protein